MIRHEATVSIALGTPRDVVDQWARRLVADHLADHPDHTDVLRLALTVTEAARWPPPDPCPATEAQCPRCNREGAVVGPRCPGCGVVQD